MKTTKKKILINLKNQFETIYGMNYQVRNTAAYVEKYLLKLRFLGITYAGWEKVPFLAAGIVTLVAGGEAFYNYTRNANTQVLTEILFAYGVVMVLLFVFFHIYGIKNKKQQIQIQLVDYLENYLANRLLRTKEGTQDAKVLNDSMEAAFIEGNARNEELKDVILKEEKDIENPVKEKPSEDMDLLCQLLRNMDSDQKSKNGSSVQEQIAVSDEGEEESEEEDPNIALLEEFVQSFLA